MWWEEIPFLKRIDRAADLGFPAIELWEWRGKDIEAIAEKVRSRGLEVLGFRAGTEQSRQPRCLREGDRGELRNR
jgi:hydroxypyruvate isomerase